ncbi:MAG: hypothetical protein BroJett033_2230 [Chloroflexota bacterium]|nr:MAG: hypothetical protein BroJett033_2230 [Chloroflexota bacterium]
MPPADTPDFDSMSPEEVMAWLETLAKRQGAHEGFTTAANVDVPEIDPSTVTIDEPGYVPYGETPPARPAAPPAPPAQVAPPAAVVPPAPPVEPARLPFADEEQETQPAPASRAAQGLAWLESLAADQGGDFPQIDLSALTVEPPAPAAPPPPVANPLDWLESLVEGQEAAAAPPAPPTPAAHVDDPLAAGVDPMLWLESLARRQGARVEELTTAADIPLPDAPPPPPAADPAAWLESMAAESGFVEEEAAGGDEQMSDVAVQRALRAGAEIPPDQMAAFLDRQLARQIDAGELSAQALDDEAEAEPAFTFDPDAPLVPGEIPAWLLEQVQIPPAADVPQPPPLIEEIVEPPAVLDLPDWLRDDFVVDSVPELEDIFAAEEPAQAASAASFIDLSDPWVEAFEQEELMPDVNSGVVPDWYARNLSDPARQAAVERLARGEPDEAAELPLETYLTPGEPEAVPEWAAADITEAIPSAVPDWLRDTVEPAAEVEIPDWLAEAAIDPTEIPDWLRDTVEPPAPARPEPLPPAPAPAPVHHPPAPTPAPAPAAALDLETVLASARASAYAGDVSAGLAGYEQIIRANTALDTVVEDLTRLVEQHSKNPAVYRVLGDGLMRQGRLQAALDTYRKALNQL